MRSTGLASLLVAVQLALPAGIMAAEAVNPVMPAAQPVQPAPTAAPASAAQPQSPPIVGHADAGHHLYTAICAYCHRLDDTVSETGAPGLKGSVRRYGEAWLDRWLADPQGLAVRDAKAKALVDANPNGLAMPALPSMQDAQNRADIIAFLKTLDTAGDEGHPANQ